MCEISLRWARSVESLSGLRRTTARNQSLSPPSPSNKFWLWNLRATASWAKIYLRASCFSSFYLYIAFDAETLSPLHRVSRTRLACGRLAGAAASKTAEGSSAAVPVEWKTMSFAGASPSRREGAIPPIYSS